MELLSPEGMELLSPEGLESFRKLKHAEFKWLDGGKELKLLLKPSVEFERFVRDIMGGICSDFRSILEKEKKQLDALKIFGTLSLFCDKYQESFISSFGIHAIGAVGANSITRGANIITQSFLDCLKSLMSDVSNRDMCNRFFEDVEENVHRRAIVFFGELYLGLELHDINELCDQVGQYRSLFEFTKENLESFSCELPSDRRDRLVKLGAGKDLPKEIRFLTAKSILLHLKELGMADADFFLELLQKTQGNDDSLVEKFRYILRESVNVIRVEVSYSDSKKENRFLMTKISSSFETNFMKVIEDAVSIESERQTLIVFLAAHKYVCTSLGKGEGLFFGSIFAGNTDDAFCLYPFFKIDPVVEPGFICTFLSLSRLESGFLGYGSTTVGASKVVSHELGHAIYNALGLTGKNATNYLCYYLENPFLKQLLYNDFDEIYTSIKLEGFEYLKNLSDEEIEELRREMVGQLEQKKVNVPSVLMKKMVDKEIFLETAIYYKAVLLVNDMWDNEKEIFNIIGLILQEGLLCVSDFSDMHSHIQQGKTIAWGHWSIQENPKDTEPVNHPTPWSLQILEALHGLPDGLLVRSFCPAS
jgi:hypothetical protein